MSDTLRNKVFSGLFWRGLERFGTQGMGFVVSVILARLLEPKDFGTIILITVFIALAGVFVSSGFGSALVQKKKVSEEDYNSVFYFSITISLLVYGIIFFIAPWIARFYDEPILVLVLRILSLSLIIGALNSIQNAVLTREMKFKLSFLIGLTSNLVSGIVGIGMAYLNYGVWSLVGMALTAQMVTTLVSWKLVDWRPKLIFSYTAIRQMFGFGSKLLASNLLDTLFNNIYNVIIGKLFTPTILGYYSRGQSIPSLVMTSVQGTISSVIFPALAACQHDKNRIKQIVSRIIKSSCFLVLPSMIGLAVIAKPLVLILFTEKWLPCVPYLQISCITFAFWPLHVANLQAIAAMGRSDIFLTLEIIKKGLIILTIAVTFQFGVMTMVLGQAVCSIICVAINAWPSRKLFDYSLSQQIRDILPIVFLSSGMGVLVWGLEWIISNIYLLLTVQIIVGIVFYISGAKIFKFEIAEYLWRTGLQALQPKLKRLM